MDQRESDPTGAFSGGSAGLADDAATEATEATEATVLPGDEKDRVTEGIAATSEIADRDAQERAEEQGDGTPRPG